MLPRHPRQPIRGIRARGTRRAGRAGRPARLPRGDRVPRGRGWPPPRRAGCWPDSGRRVVRRRSASAARARSAGVGMYCRARWAGRSLRWASSSRRSRRLSRGPSSPSRNRLTLAASDRVKLSERPAVPDRASGRPPPRSKLRPPARGSVERIAPACVLRRAGRGFPERPLVRAPSRRPARASWAPWERPPVACRFDDPLASPARRLIAPSEFLARGFSALRRRTGRPYLSSTGLPSRPIK